MSESDLWLWVLYLHLLAMTFFLGGQLVFAVAVAPVERHSPDPERMRAIARRFGYGSIIALAILLATGTAMATHEHRWSDPTLQLKLGFVAAVILLTGAHLRWPRLHVIHALTLLVSLVIVWLGLNLVS